MALQLLKRTLRPSLLKSVVQNGRALCTAGRSETQLTNQQAREDLALCYRGMNFYGLGEGVCNHLTLRAPARNSQGEVMLLIPYGLHWSQVTASKLIGIDINSQKAVEGEELHVGEMSAICIHTAMHRAMEKEIKCVMHGHPPYATALSLLKDPRLKMSHQNAMRFFGKIAYDTRFEGAGDMGDEGERLARLMKGKEVFIMGNHGLLTVGQTAAFAFDVFYYVERVAMFQILAESTGKELSEASDEVSQKVADHLSYENLGRTYSEAHFSGLKKVIEVQAPDFRS